MSGFSAITRSVLGWSDPAQDVRALARARMTLRSGRVIATRATR